MGMSSRAAKLAKEAMAAHVLDLMRGLGPVSAKAMFGGHGIYLDGLMFGLLANERLYIKVDDDVVGAFTARGLGPFTFVFKGKPGHLRYHEVPPECYDEPEHMVQWARLGLQAALRQRALQAAKPKRARRVGATTDVARTLENLRNLGPKSREMLGKAGIRTEAQLRQLGAVRAYVQAKAVWPQASLNLLWALEGALSERDWREVAQSERASLLMALEDLR
jgi:DNA transformation protein and related proteins